jgi:ATP-dependent helicase HrpA
MKFLRLGACGILAAPLVLFADPNVFKSGSHGGGRSATTGRSVDGPNRGERTREDFEQLRKRMPGTSLLTDVTSVFENVVQQGSKRYVDKNRAFIGDQLPVRSEKEFAFRVGVGIDRLGPAVEEVTALAAAILTGFQQVQFALAQAKAPALAASTADIRDQLGALTPPDFLISTPYPWLRHYPRYFQAILLRLQKISGPGVARDAKNLAEVTPLWRGYHELEKRKKELGLSEARIIEYRWMVEEMRVSLFAQELRTAVPVSIKRIQDVWAAIVKGAAA